MKTERMNKPLNLIGQQSGFSIVQVIIAIAFFGLAFAGINQAMVNELLAKKSLVASSSYTNIHKDLKMELVSRVLSNVGPRCITNVSRAFRGSKVGENSDLALYLGQQHSKNKLRGPEERCKKPKRTNSSQYFCLSIAKDPESPKNSFTNGSSDALLEVFVEFQNIAGKNGNTALSCRDFVNHPNPENLVKIFYSLYWTVDSTGTKKVSKRRNGIFYGHGRS